MSQFQLMAKVNIQLSGGMKIDKGQTFFVNLYKEYSYLILNKLEGLPCFGVMIWQPF